MRFPVHYAASGDVQIAYQVTGGGPIDLVVAPGTFSHLDLSWDSPANARINLALGSFARLIRFDKRGTGLSDRPTDVATLEERTDDIRAVMDAAGSERAALLGLSEGGSMACMFAAMHPARVSSLVLYGVQARWTQTDDYPWGLNPAQFAHMIDDLKRNWPSADYIVGYGAGYGKDVDPALLEAVMHRAQASASPRAIVALEEMNALIDTRDILPTIRVPTLVMNRTGDPVANVDAARDVAGRIPGARFVEFPGDMHTPEGIEDEVVAEIRGFVTGVRVAAPLSRMLATILFVDIVASTELAARIGDRPFRDLLDRYYVLIGHDLAEYGGKEINRAGDGLLATFDGPTRAIKCALAIGRTAHDLRLQVRAGIHTGEVELVGGDVRGIAVHLAARVAALAGPDEVLVSSTVRDLTAGSGLSLVDRGVHELKGVPEPRQLFAVG
jgi:class 3 adenylate cyclase